jgi:hypothetical protein
MPTRPKGSAEALKDYFHATNHLLEYAIRLIESPQTDTVTKTPFRESAAAHCGC